MTQKPISEIVEGTVEDIVAQMHLWQENELTVKEFADNLRKEIAATLEADRKATRDSGVFALNKLLLERGICISQEIINEALSTPNDIISKE